MNTVYAQDLDPRLARSAGRKPAAEASPQLLRLCIYAAMLATDAGGVATAFFGANYLRFGDPLAAPGVTMLGALLPLYVIFATIQRNYSSILLADWRAAAKQALISLAWAAVAMLFVGFYLRAFSAISRDVATSGMLASGSLLVLNRAGLQLVRKVARLGRLYNELVVIDRPRGDHAAPEGRWVDARELGIAPDTSNPTMLNRFGRLLKGADRVIVSCDAQTFGDWAAMLKAFGVRGELLMPEIARYGSVGVGSYAAASTLIVSDAPLKLSDRALKRALDIAVSSLALLVLAPLLVLVAVALKLQSPGPVFFRQPRMGQGNQLFYILKFRTMRVEACDGSGTKSTRRDDDRVTVLGRLLRKSSIDELPQLLNVLKGEMSIVGPRPHALGSLAGDKLFWEVDRRYWERHAAKPGITGLAQIRGFRGPTEREADLSQRLSADLDYLRNWTIWRDFMIMFATAKVMFHSNAV